MFRDNERIDITELEIYTIRMLHEVLLRIDKEILSIKNYTKEEMKKINEDYKNRCESAEPEFGIYEIIRNFYKQFIVDLTEMQTICSKHKIQSMLDMAKEMKLRLEPANYKCYEKEMKKIIRESSLYFVKKNNFQLTEEPKTYETCHCRWMNISESELKPTQDILINPIIPAKTEFDKSDLKFQQELVLLRTKIFTLPEMIPKRRKISGLDRAFSLLTEMKTISNMDKTKLNETLENTASQIVASVEEEARKINSLKFIDGKLGYCDLWKRLLDACGNQLRSKWHLVLCPQMENMLKKYIVSSAQFRPEKVFVILSRIEENGSQYILTKEEMIYMLSNDSDVSQWLMGLKTRSKDLAGMQNAATIIQRYWKGYSVRKEIRESDCKYIAASMIWMGWLFVKKRRYMRTEYLKKMLIKENIIEKLNIKLSKNYNEIIGSPHVVIHIPSLGFPLDIRSSISPQIFKIYQNIQALRLSFLKNPNAEVIYILPIEPSDSLLKMYYDILESVHPNEGIQRRVTFLALSMRQAFVKLSFNTSRTLYYSDDTVTEICAKIIDKPAYILPWVMDECDVWTAGVLDVPWIGPSLNLQLRLLNKSNNAELLTNFGIDQPAYIPYIKDYITLCEKLAELIYLHSEICLWLIKINIGIDGNQTGIFLINNISLPFMPELRKAREKYNEKWLKNIELKNIYLKRLIEHLPNVVFNATRLSTNYQNWKEFYSSIIKYGCFIQAVPNERNFSIVSSAIFISSNHDVKPIWIGTVDQMHLESQFTAFGFMMPQTSFPNEYLEIVVSSLSEALQKIGYQGYVSFDLFCYIRRSDDIPIALVLDIDPYYSKIHNFLDWFSFTINGKYQVDKNSFESDVEISAEAKTKYYHPVSKNIRWDETNERFGIAMGRLHHTQLYRHRWPKLLNFTKKCKITYDAKTRIGSHVAFHDGESRAHVMMTSCNVTMKQCLQNVTSNLKNLSKALTIRYDQGVVETNISAAASYLAKLTSTYHPIHRRICPRENK